MRLFFALWPEPQIRANIADAAAVLRLGSDARAVPRENYHLTLAFLGEVADSQLAVLQRIGRSAQAAGFTIKLDAYEHWREPRVLVAAASETPAELTLLQARLQAQSRAQYRPPLRPHVTLARKVAQAPVPQAMSPLYWSARSFSLVCSETSGAHSVYTVVDTWPLLDETPKPEKSQ
ncbi:MAG TPA: RNA 2',3'-cyclic phosphodiesterase [Steroidobacteraceae bacterium]|nr:RNA 2',3'-cyclic phosphodiesterase [Steroidobacteraceae bacterium]